MQTSESQSLRKSSGNLKRKESNSCEGCDSRLRLIKEKYDDLKESIDNHKSHCELHHPRQTVGNYLGEVSKLITEGLYKIEDKRRKIDEAHSIAVRTLYYEDKEQSKAISSGSNGNKKAQSDKKKDVSKEAATQENEERDESKVGGQYEEHVENPTTVKEPLKKQDEECLEPSQALDM